MGFGPPPCTCVQFSSDSIRGKYEKVEGCEQSTFTAPTTVCGHKCTICNMFGAIQELYEFPLQKAVYRSVFSCAEALCITEMYKSRYNGTHAWLCEGQCGIKIAASTVMDGTFRIFKFNFTKYH